MRILTIDDKYCSKCGHPWVLVANTTLYPEYYYCQNCDKIFVLTTKEVKKEEIDSEFEAFRYNSMKEYAILKKAKESVTKQDLIELGRL